MDFYDNLFNSGKLNKSKNILILTKTEKDYYFNNNFNIVNKNIEEINTINNSFDVIIFVNIYTSFSNCKCNEILNKVKQFLTNDGFFVYINELVTNFSFHPIFSMKNFLFDNLSSNFGRSIHIDCFHEYIRENELKVIDVDRIYSYSSLTFNKEYFSFICIKK